MKIINKFIKNFIVGNLMRNVGKRGQITIFVIIAIVIVGALIIFFAATDIGRGIVERTTGQEFDIRNSLENCIEDNTEIDKKIENIMIHGGEINPEFAYLYNNIEMKYLCYTNEYYVTCVNQQPLLLQHVEEQIKTEITPDVQECITKLSGQLSNRGYDVSAGTLDVDVDLIPENLVIKVAYPLSITRGGTTSRFDDFEIREKSEAYQLIMIATSITNFEASLGDSETTSYMALYPSKKVEKLKQGDGTTVYLLSDRNTDEQFNFASRSLAWPPGYIG